MEVPVVRRTGHRLSGERERIAGSTARRSLGDLRNQWRRRGRGRLWRRSPRGGGWRRGRCGPQRRPGSRPWRRLRRQHGSRRSGARGSRRPPSRSRLGSRAWRLDERQRRILRRRRGGCALRTRDGQERPGRPGPTDARGDADRDEGQGRQHHERSTRIAKESAPRGRRRRSGGGGRIEPRRAGGGSGPAIGGCTGHNPAIDGDPGGSHASEPRDGCVVPIGSGCTGRPDPIRHLIGCEGDGRQHLLRRRVGGSPAQPSDDVTADRPVDDGSGATSWAIPGGTTAADERKREPHEPDDRDGGDERSACVQFYDPSMGGGRVRRAASRRDATTGRRDRSLGRST